MKQRTIKGSWLEDYMKFTKGQESPEMFHLWVGISVIASALERSVFLNRGYYTLYPNLYVILVADSAICKKTTATNIGVKLLESLDNAPPIFSQKITPEALISSICGECIVDENNNITKNATAIVYGPELSVFLGREAYSSGLVSILTSLYDCPDEWEYETIGRGKDVAYNTCINMLGASTPEWLRLSIPPDAVGGGFTSRVLFVYQFTSNRIIPHPMLTQEEVDIRERLIEDLNIIRTLRGEFTFTKEAYDFYASWYTDHRLKQIAGKDYTVRKEDTALKLAMIFSVAQGNSLEITKAILEMAIDTLDQNEKFLPEAMRILSSTPVGVYANKVATIIKKQPEGMLHGELIRKTMYTIDASKVTEVLETLIAAGVISLHVNASTSERFYIYNEDQKKGK